MDIKGKVAVVTGGASGIGRATAEMLAAGGAAIVIADLAEAAGHETVQAIEAAGGRAAFVKADVTGEDDTRRMLDTAIQKFGGLDILYNNAGIAVGLPGYPQAEIKRWRWVIEIDLVAVILGCHLAAPLMDPKGGVIINTASMAGLYPFKEDPVYGAAKAGVVNFTYSLAPWAAKRNIRVNCVCPGVVDTPLVRKGIEAAKRAGQSAGIPATIMPPTAIANAVLSLIRDNTMFGRALEVRPSGPRLIETPIAPGTRR
jgi:NAD(P)-dependent dehydrogenase (short-subunit alcohol dehydrogenase family)